MVLVTVRLLSGIFILMNKSSQRTQQLEHLRYFINNRLVLALWGLLAKLYIKKHWAFYILVGPPRGYTMVGSQDHIFHIFLTCKLIV